MRLFSKGDKVERKQFRVHHVPFWPGVPLRGHLFSPAGDERICHNLRVPGGLFIARVLTCQVTFSQDGEGDSKTITSWFRPSIGAENMCMARQEEETHPGLESTRPAQVQQSFEPVTMFKVCFVP